MKKKSKKDLKALKRVVKLIESAERRHAVKDSMKDDVIKVALSELLLKIGILTDSITSEQKQQVLEKYQGKLNK